MKALRVIAVVVAGVLLGAALLDFVLPKALLLSLGQPTRPYAPGFSIQLWQTYAAQAGYRWRLALIASVVLVPVAIVMVMALARMLRRNTSQLHGTARFATMREIRDAGLLAKRGILFGDTGGKYLCIDGQRHLFAVAPTRSGKTVGIAIPNLLNWPDSVLALDIKLELFEKTSGFRAAHGQEVWLFNPFASDYRTHRWNPLDVVRRGESRPSIFTVQDLMAIGAVLYPTADETQSNTRFFNAQAQNLLTGLALLVLETPGLPFTLAQVLRTSAGTHQGGLGEYLQYVLSTRTTLSQACRDALSQFVGNSGDTLSGIKATFEAPLLVFRNPLVEAATSASDFKLADMRRKRMAIYLGVGPRNMGAGATLMTLFVSQALDSNLDALPEQDASIRYQALFLLDEFRVLGKMQQLVDAAGYLAGYGVRLCTIVQSMGQLHIYGKEAAQAFVTNHGVKVVYAPREEADAKDISEALGSFTEMSESYSRNRGGGSAQGGSGLSQGTSTSAQRRALMLPQEVKLMPQHEELAFVEGIRPIKARKICYYQDASFLRRLLPPVVVPLLGGMERLNANDDVGGDMESQQGQDLVDAEVARFVANFSQSTATSA